MTDQIQMAVPQIHPYLQAHPVVAVLGGETAGKMELAGRLSELADIILIGGGIANTFLRARGGRVGKSEVGDTGLAREILERAAAGGAKVFLPVDVLAANTVSSGVQPSLEGAMALFDDKIAMDIGPRTITLFRNLILTAETVILSGSMGMYELAAFSGGTREILKAAAEAKGETLVFDSDTVRAIEYFGCAGSFQHIFSDSVGGSCS